MGRDRVAGLWTLGRAYAMVNAMKCISLMLYRPVPLKQIIHFMLININKSVNNNNGREREKLMN